MISKVIELAIIIGIIAVPASAARHKNPRVGLRKLVRNMLLFEALWLFAMRFLHGRW